MFCHAGALVTAFAGAIFFFFLSHQALPWPIDLIETMHRKPAVRAIQAVIQEQPHPVEPIIAIEAQEVPLPRHKPPHVTIAARPKVLPPR